MTQILTNPASNSIILTLNNTLSADSNILSLDPGESVLYNSVAITDPTDKNYNVTLLQDYVDNGVLLLETLTATHSSGLQILTQANLTLGLGSGVPEIVCKSAPTESNNLEILPVLDTYGSVFCIYYKTTWGVSVSFDLGATQTLISNENLLFPDEITSIAAQSYDSNGGILVPAKRLYIGTLREGVKTFTPGIDTTYVDFDPNAKFDNSASIFKHCTTETKVTNITNDGGPVDTSTSYIYTYADYCPSFVLGIFNKSINSGCGILVATRPTLTEFTTTTNIAYTGGVIANFSTDVSVTTSAPAKSNKTKVSFKYLHDYIFKDNVVIPTIDSTLPQPSYLTNSNGWVKVQELGTTVDSTSNILSSITFQDDILDCITEYTPTGALFVTKDSTGHNNLYEFTSSININALPTIIEIQLVPSILQTAKINGISYADGYIFIALSDSVWKYDSGVWSLFIHKDAAHESYTGSGVINDKYLDNSVTN